MEGKAAILPFRKGESGKRKKSKRKGISKHPLYLVRRAMIHRCYNPKQKCYYNYGGRGIRVYQEWIDNQDAFIDYCISIGWKQGLQMDRIDNNGDYEPGNIRFVTQAENSRNTRMNNHITIDGVTKVLEDWCKLYNITSKVVCSRIRSGWAIKEAFETPIFEKGDGKRKKLLTLEEANQIRDDYKQGGIFQYQLAEKYNVAKSVVNQILQNTHKRYKI